MINRRIFLKTPAIFLPLMAGLPTVQAGQGADYIRSTGDLSSDIAAAKATVHHNLYMPTGDYPIGALDLGNCSGLTIWGDGERTRLISDGAVTSGVLSLLHIYQAQDVVLSDFSVVVQNASGAGSIKSIAVDYNALGARLDRIECIGGYGATGAGGSAFDLYQNSAFGGGYSYATINDCTARDLPSGCGMIMNSQGNRVERFTALNCGSTTLQHGMYIQGGENTFSHCLVSQSGGYNFHNYAAVPDRAASFNRYTNCTSIDPVFGHFIATSINASATNPDVPSGTPLNRGVSLSGCAFRRTKNGPACYNGVGGGVPLLIDGCTFEDALGAAGAWVGVGAGSRVTNSLFRQIVTVQNIVGVVASGGATVIGNHFLNWLSGTAIRADGLSGVWQNSGDLYGSSLGLYVNGTDVQHGGNIFQVHGNAKATYGSMGVV